MLLTPVTGPPGTYPHLVHAPWDGFTVSDAIFPTFLVGSGASLALLLRPTVTAETRRRLVRRTVALVLIGVAYNGIGQPLDLASLRFTGVLQLIGLAGGLAALVVLLVRRFTDHPWPLALVAGVLPAVHGWVVAGGQTACSGAVPGCSPWLRLEARVLGESHLYRQGTARHDPEGLAVVVVATSLVLVGYLAMEAVRRRGVGWRVLALIALVGVGLMVLSVPLDAIQPVNKRLHTPAFSLRAGGIALTLLAAALATWDLGWPRRLPARLSAAAAGVRSWLAQPLVTLGRNALVVYVGERVLLTAAVQTEVQTAGGPVTVQTWVVQGLLSAGEPRVHLLYTALLLGVILVLTTLMRGLRWHIVL